MALVSENVRVAVTGAVSMGDTDAPEPEDSTSPLPAAYTDLGYVGEDGVTEKRDRSTEQIKAWQNAAVVRETVTEASLTYEMVLIETKRETVELYYGSRVESNGSLAIIPANTGGRHSFVLDVVDGDQYIRAYLPTAEVTEVGEQVYANGEPIGYEVTITAYPGEEGYSALKFYSALAGDGNGNGDGTLQLAATSTAPGGPVEFTGSGFEPETSLTGRAELADAA